jgi:AraC-like DNA-binding protein
MNRYTEYTPSAHLKNYVDCYWSYDPSHMLTDRPPVNRCLPLGTVEIIMQVDDVPCIILNSTTQAWEKSHRIYFTGLFTETNYWKSDVTSRMFGIRLKPEALIDLFNFPASLLFNKVEDAEAILGTTARRLYTDISDQPGDTHRVTVAERFMLALLHNGRQRRNYAVEACRRIRNTHARISLDALSADIGISIRQLQRTFKENIGTSPKSYQRIVRFRGAYTCLRRQYHTGINWSDLSYQLGYADQAHLIREWREFTDDAPSAFLTENFSFFQTLEACS